MEAKFKFAEFLPAAARASRARDKTEHRSRAQVHCVALLPDGRVVSGSTDKSLKVWQTS